MKTINQQKGNVLVGALSAIAAVVSITIFVISPLNQNDERLEKQIKENTNHITMIANDLAYIKGGLDMLLSKNNISPEQVKQNINHYNTASSSKLKLYDY